VQFVVYSHSAKALRVLLYDGVADTEPAEVISLDPAIDRWGDIWSILVPGVAPGQLYHIQADGQFAPEIGQRFDGRARLVDPYARALAGDFLVAADGTLVPRPSGPKQKWWKVHRTSSPITSRRSPTRSSTEKSDCLRGLVATATTSTSKRAAAR
jgi:pullulanase/glycogen debranching enzyme